MFERPPWSYGTWATLRWTSEDHGWTSLLVHEFENARVADDVELGATGDQQIVLVVAGTSRIASRRGRRWVEAADFPGKIGMIAPGTPTVLRWEGAGPGPLRRLRVHVPGRLLREAAEELWGGRTSAPQASGLSVSDPALVHAVLSLRRAAAAGAPDAYADATARFLAVHTLAHHTGVPLAPPPSDDRRVARAVDFMREHLGEPVAVADIAAAAGLSPFHFTRVFQASRGTTPLRFLTGLRVEAARRLLARPEVAVIDVARACGFTSSSYFARVFARHVGATPSAYRAAVTAERRP